MCNQKADINLISVIVPFYEGNKYITELLESVNKCSKNLVEKFDSNMEVIIVNDSPWIEVEYKEQDSITVSVVENEKNIGIHASRVHGIQCAQGDWIILLDQDDLLIDSKYYTQLDNLSNTDVVVGNGFYYFGSIKKRIYTNEAVMKHKIRERNFVKIRNLIPSPGECIIRKKSIPDYWMRNTMKSNGADDWFLWLLIFAQGSHFEINSDIVYIHRTNEEGNLSADLDKMYKSCNEMCKILKEKIDFDNCRIKQLQRAIDFKYLYDTKKITIGSYLKYFDCFINNVLYKITDRLLSIM